MLRIVHPINVGNMPSRRRSFPSPVLSLTDEEARHVRVAIRGVARSYGSVKALAQALGVNPVTLTRRQRPAAGIVIAVARLAHISVDAMLSGKLADASVCITCGAKGGAR